MSPLRRFIHGDEELGKRNDDHQYRRSQSPKATPTATSFTWRGPRRKRTLLVLAVLSLLYVFFKNIPTDAFTATQRAAARNSFPRPSRYGADPPKGPPPRSEDSVAVKHYYEGPIVFSRLTASLSTGLASLRDNRNVLFVVSNLKSAASLLPLACEMSNRNRSKVHMMLVGRDDLSIEKIEEINGITQANCHIYWYDGRPDYSVYSTHLRMKFSVGLSLGRIASRMRLGVVLIDNEDREDDFLCRGVREKTRLLGLQLIELPNDAAENLKWISRLDVSSLASWNDVNIDILIHSPPESSGSVIRLLRSLESADYFGFPYPRLTIELPHNVDPPTLQYLSTFRWPPNSRLADSRLTLRHRLSSVQMDATQASIRQIESFYPANVPKSNVLLLSPQVELSPLYFQYLVYSLLEYKHSDTAMYTSADLLGISLETPATTLDNKVPLSPPDTTSYRPFFLHESPNSNAALYFGDKWVELHSFLSNRLASSRADTVIPAKDPTAYHIARTYPAWLNFTLELCRARGYTMLYPSLQSPATSLATIHTELYQPPEEYNQPPSDQASSSGDQNITESLDFSSPGGEESTSQPPISHSLFSLLDPTSNSKVPPPSLPDLSNLPLLSHTGEHLTDGQTALTESAATYADAFSNEHGGCREPLGTRKRGQKISWTADDLFCFESEAEGKGR